MEAPQLRVHHTWPRAATLGRIAGLIILVPGCLWDLQPWLWWDTKLLTTVGIPIMVLRWSGTNWLTLVSLGLATMALVGYKVTYNHWDPYHGTEMVWD